MSAVRLVFLGPPGTGKGTQARRLATRFDLVAMSSGDVLRAEIKRDSEIGRSARQYVEGGTLVPDDVITGVMLAGIDQAPAGQGFILDGFPRTVPQAEALEVGLSARGQRLDGVLDFRMADHQIIERIVSRRVCSKCGATYNTRFAAPRVKGRCDACGGPLVQRIDDREEVIATRLATYRSLTAPLVEFYARQGILRGVDAAPGAEEVEAAVCAAIQELRRAP